MIKSMGIVANQQREEILGYVVFLIQWLEKKGIKAFVINWMKEKINRPISAISKEEMGKKVDLIISLGGDGTLCRAARDFSPYRIPLLGINMGGLGFLTEIPASQAEQGLIRVMEGKYRIEKRLMLEANVHRGERKVKSSLALNDVVITRGALSRLIKLETFVSGEFITTYSADGLIISTPTGSTAYSLSAGGPIVHPSLGVILLSPICAHTLAVRPLIISQDDRVEIFVEHPSSKVMLTIDGQIGFDLEDKDVVRVEKASCEARLVRLEERGFFKMLRTKLGWSGKPMKIR